jgi:hypothetical protein
LFKFETNLFMKKILSLLALTLLGVSAQAGRPLNVDDANVNDQGVAHVETFWSRAADGSRTLTLAPTYSPLPGLDLIAQDVKTFSGGPHSQTFQAKMQVTAPKEKSCHFAWVLGVTQWQKGEGQKSFVAGNTSCDIQVWSVPETLRAKTCRHGAWPGNKPWAIGRLTLNQWRSVRPNLWWALVCEEMCCQVCRWMALGASKAAKRCSAWAPSTHSSNSR